ncbi:hypothetical protein [Streptomyces sp. NPDC050564]|uniref:hypothetical protein n=1 Tax=Streptomyces sp. NPDC050564 TaxID=3365631 RepID=UPI00378D563B
MGAAGAAAPGGGQQRRARGQARAFSTSTLVWADAGYAGRFVRDARRIWDLAVAIVKRPDPAKGTCSTVAG